MSICTQHPLNWMIGPIQISMILISVCSLNFAREPCGDPNLRVHLFGVAPHSCPILFPHNEGLAITMVPTY